MKQGIGKTFNGAIFVRGEGESTFHLLIILVPILATGGVLIPYCLRQIRYRGTPRTAL